MEFYFRNQTRFKISPKFFRSLWEIFAQHEKKIGKFKEIGLVLVGSKLMQALNQRYRQKRKTTDVLTFVFDATWGPAAHLLGQERGGGVEVYISPKQALIQAQARGGSFYAELALLLIHGLLHALGYTDEEKDARIQMLRRQNALLEYCLPVINLYRKQRELS